MRFNLSWIWLWLPAVAPLLVLTVAIALERARRRRTEKPPQTERLLRPPGHSLSVRLDEFADAGLLYLLASSGFCMFAYVVAVGLWTSFSQHTPLRWWVISILILAAFELASAFFAWKVYRGSKEMRDTRLGLRGEQAVAEALSATADSGFRAFHDLPDQKIGNIDHVAVGPRGVFLIETKARSRRASRHGQAEHEVIYDGESLQFPFYRDAQPIEQAKMNAKWLSHFLEKKMGEKVWVEPLVVLPGWFVRNSEKGEFPVKVMNANYLVGFLRRQAERIEPAQVRRIITALDEKCRDVEF